jgi:hypothetical protein
MKGKIMKKFALLILSLLVLASSAFAQERRPPNEKELQVLGEVNLQDPPPPLLAGNTFAFVSSEFSFDRVVKGAPYSALAVTESTQTLSDGNRIVNTRSVSVYRDGEGRTRREQSVMSIGPYLPSLEPMKTVLIYDPNAGVTYSLDPGSHIARKNPSMRLEQGSVSSVRTQGAVAAVGPEENLVFTRTTNGEVQGNVSGGAIKMRIEKDRTDVKQESLGTQTIEGVSAVGSRTTISLPAGQIGNERPIEIVEERWFSKELQTLIMTRRSDPRSGEVIYRLTNIDRSEPDRTLFEVPAGYTVKEEQPLRFKFDPPVRQEQ